MKEILLGFVSVVALGLVTPERALPQDRRESGRHEDRADDRR